MNLYLENGYLNVPELIKLPVTFIWCFGGRGTGKTYGALKYAIEIQGAEHPFLHIRRRDKEIKLFKTPDHNPFGKLNKDMNWNIKFKMSDDCGVYYDNGVQVGSVAALSTFANLRGVDCSSCNFIFFDEFIPERNQPWIKEESSAFFNLYETVCRNRELEGDAPVKMLAAANANDAANPYFLSMGVITTVEKMKREKRQMFINRERDFALINLENSPISEKKKNTALYKLTRGSDYEKMALDNSFSFNDFSNISARDLTPYKPIVAIGEITIYKHKSERVYYVSEHRSGAPVLFGTNDRELEKFRQSYWRVWNAYIDGNVNFENYLTKVLFKLYFK